MRQVTARASAGRLAHHHLIPSILGHVVAA
jgi:hypothetical protein